MPKAALPALVRALTVGVAYYAAAVISIELTREAGNVAAFWPPNAILLGVLLRRSAREGPLPVIVCALVNFVLRLRYGEPLEIAVSFACANTLEVGIVFGLIARSVGLPFALEGLNRLWTFLGSGMIGTMAGASVGAALIDHHFAASLSTIWRTWWMAHATGMLLLTPIIVAFRPISWRHLRSAFQDRLHGLELLAALVLLAAGLWLAIDDSPYGSPVLLTPILIWLALRHGVRAAAIAGAVVGVTALIATIDNIWPPAFASGATITDRTGPLQLYMATTMLLPLTIAVMISEREQARTALLERERRFALALEGTTDSLWDWDLRRDRLFLSDRCYTMLGYVPGEFPADGATWLEHIHPEDREPACRALDAHLEGRTPAYQAEYRSRHKDGRWIWILDRGKVVERDAHGRPLRAVGVNTDLTERKELERALAAEHQRLQAVIRTAVDGVLVFDERGTIQTFNPAAERIFGYHAGEVLGQNVTMLVREPYRSDHDGHLAHFIGSDTHPTTGSGRVVEGLREDGSTFPMELAVGEIEGSEPRMFVGTFRDITRRKQLESQLAHQATHDPLTDLPNRAMLTRELERACARVDRNGGQLALMLVDLDRFKLVNDTHGHCIGDKLLLEVAARLRAAVREGDLVTRLGGDEFAILAEGSDPAEFRVLAQRVVERLAAAARFGAVELEPGGSVGFTVYPDDPGRPEELQIHADRALYAAKAAGRRCWAAYDPAHRAADGAGGTVGDELGGALERGELDLDFQPIVALDTLDVVGIEALLRWDHPTRGRLSAGGFVEAAERGPWMLPINRFVLRRALRQQCQWRKAGIADLRLWVNLSPRCLRWDGLVDAVAHELAAAETAPERLVLEVTEEAFVDLELAQTRLEALRLLGVGIAVDDFGTGYSSLGRLRTLPLDVLKIDRTFVSEVTQRPRDQAIVRTIAALGTDLGLTPAAEGIETMEQLRTLRRLGCVWAQGYLFARPMPGPELARWFAAWEERRRLLPRDDLLRVEVAASA